jgi:hypothetical protein
VDLQRGVGQQILVDDVVDEIGMLDFVFHGSTGGRLRESFEKDSLKLPSKPFVKLWRDMGFDEFI